MLHEKRSIIWASVDTNLTHFLILAKSSLINLVRRSKCFICSPHIFFSNRAIDVFSGLRQKYTIQVQRHKSQCNLMIAWACTKIEDTLCCNVPSSSGCPGHCSVRYPRLAVMYLAFRARRQGVSAFKVILIFLLHLRECHAGGKVVLQDLPRSFIL
jgi:hypothetical protein